MHVYTLQAIVTAVDVPKRHVTLKDSENEEFTFVAEPEVKNLPQVHVGDKVTVTLTPAACSLPCASAAKLRRACPSGHGVHGDSNAWRKTGLADGR